MARKSKPTYYEIIAAAIDDMNEHGYDSADRVAFWSEQIREAAEGIMLAPHSMEQQLRESLQAIYKQMVDNGDLARYHQGVTRFTIEKVRPSLRAELDRRIVASANLIKLNRQASIQKTLQRFSGWATSIPKGGAAPGQKAKAKIEVKKPLQRLPFTERRVLIDQSAKFVSALSDILAQDSGAIAAIWHSRWRVENYNYREPHKEIDLNVYAIRGNWAISKGLMRAGPNGFTDKIPQPAELPFCRCHYQYIYALRDLPDNMMTPKGNAALKQARAEIAKSA